ncbi:ARM repeat-containing protein [Moesziomyces antarcticus]|uniref:MMS19 nucleotide excision repair protein n=2 Tax=Pseudozyma antarctica TaxID=84753 RepID=A0A081CFS2_PSEA2|nr:ARM repeat-containing protein [Moesziomyces antarcticus]GAK65518.1 ARM repeat-containing protein [Moesziomyces antarcticus]SPO46527.1 related to Transcriptional coactivator MMS19 [Moesziomyces antarcticus]
MSDPAQAVRAFMVGSFQQLPPSLVDDLATGAVSLLGVVRLLGEYLTSEDEETRTRAVQLLSDLTCHFLDPDTPPPQSETHQPLSGIFTIQAVRTLSSFFADKIADGVIISDNFVRSAKAPEVLPESAPRARRNEAEQKTLQGSAMLVSSLKALSVLSACKAPAAPAASSEPAPVKGFGQEQAHAVAEALFSHVVATNHPQSLRFIIYRLLDSLIAHHRDALKTFRSSSAASASSDPPQQASAASPPAAMDLDESAEKPEAGQSGIAASQSETCEGKDFLQGYVKMVQGEKDPRNLMVLFGVDKVLLTEWVMDREMTEKFFDITFCYFPITFRPPPDDPYGITSDDLKVALRAAISASPAMAPFGYPLLLEKLSAAGGPAKLDTLRTLIAAMPVYGRAAALANAAKLWEGLKIEIFHATDDETGDLAVDTLTVLLHVLYHGVDPPEGVAPKMVHDCLVELEEPGKSLAKAGIKVLSCLVRASASTAYLAVYGFMDQMIKMFADPEDLAQRTPILAGIGELLEVVAKVYRHAELAKNQAAVDAKAHVRGHGEGAASEIGSGQLLPASAIERSYAGDNRPLDPFISDLLNCLSNGLRSTSYRRSAMLVFSSVVSISILSSNSVSPADGTAAAVGTKSNKALLDFDELSFLTREVASLLVSSVGDDVREEALCAIEVISNERTANTLAAANPTARVIEQVVLPVLLEKLPDRIEPVGNPEERSAGSAVDEIEAELDLAKANIRRSLSALSRLCVAPFLFEAVVVKLFTKLELCCRPSARPTTSVENEEGKDATTVQVQARVLQEANLGYARGLILTLQTMVDLKRQNAHRDLAKYAQTLPSRLVSLTLSGLEAASATGQLSIAAHPAVVADTAALLGTFVKLLDANRQLELLASLNKTFVRGQAPFVDAASGSAGESLISSGSTLARSFAPFSTDGASNVVAVASRNAVALLSAAVVASAPAAGAVQLGSASESVGSRHEAALASLACLLDWTLRTVASNAGSDDAVYKASQALQLNSAYWAAAALVNKFIDETQPAFLTLLDDFWGQNIKTTGQTGTRRVALQVWMWLTRALVVKSSKLAEAMLNRVLIEIFDDVSGAVVSSGQLVQSSGAGRSMDWKFARAAARDLSTIVGVAEDGISTKENGFTVRLLWKQKLFSFVLPRLLESYAAASKHSHHVHGDHCHHATDTVDAKTIYLVSLAGLLPSLPPSMLVERLEGLFPLLIQALELPDSKARSAAANALTVASEVGKKIPAPQDGFNPTKLIVGHLSAITAKLLANIEPGTHSPPSTRIAALRTLSSLAARTDSAEDVSTQTGGLEHHHLHPLRNVVLKKLAHTNAGIDDPVRAVRTAAVDARDAWFAVAET